MRFLYADDTPAPYDGATLVMLREAVSCAVALLAAADLIDRRSAAIRDRQALAVRRFADIQAFGRQLIDLLGRGQTLGSLPDRIRQAAADEVASDVREVRAAVERERDRLEAEIAGARTTALERVRDLLRAYDLPGSHGQLELTLADDGAYAAGLQVSCERGLEARFGLAAPERGPLARAARVRELSRVQRLPMSRVGRLRSTPRVVTRNVDRWYLVGLLHTGARTVVRLREEPHDRAAGVDLDFDGAGIDVRAVAREGEAALPVHRPAVDDAEALRQLERDLVEAALPLAEARVSVHSVALDGVELGDCDPSDVADHVIGAIAETYRAIVNRSGEADSLVLLERVSSGSRQRLALSIAELDELVDTLPPPLRRRFAALPLGTRPAPPPAPPGPRRGTEVDRGW